jgi:hypothetical protein
VNNMGGGGPVVPANHLSQGEPSMAVAASKPSTVSNISDTMTLGNRKMRTRRLTFSGNYATGGETISPSLFGFRKIEQLITPGGVAMASALSTGVLAGWDAANSKMVFFEGSAAGTALSEKTNAEAYPTGCFMDVTAIGV